MVSVEWLEPVHDLFDGLPPKDQAAILQKLELVKFFPEMFALRRTGRFRRHRSFVAGDWLIYYRRRGDTVYIRALWPARARPL